VPCRTGTGEGEGAVEKEVASEEMEGLLDSLTPIYNQLRMVEGWLVLEVLLLYKYRYQKTDNT
jgi:hypothetical protein